MKRIVRIEGTTQDELCTKAQEYFKTQLIRIFDKNNKWFNKDTCGFDAGGTQCYVTGDGSNARIQCYRYHQYGALGFRVDANCYEADTKIYSVTMHVDEGDGFFRFEHCIQGKMPIAEQWRGGMAFGMSIDGNSCIYMHNMSEYWVRWANTYYAGTASPSPHSNTFWDLHGYAVPPGQVALFCPGDGINFYKDFYRYTHNVTNLSLPVFSYQTLEGLGTFFIYHNGIWLPDSPPPA